REVVVISSFPVGSLSASDIAALPQSVGLKLIAIPLAPDPQPTGAPLDARGDRDAPRSVTPRLTLGPGETSVSWLTGPRPTSPSIDWRARPEDAARLATVTGAAFDLGIATRAADRPVVVVLPETTDRAALMTGAVTIDTGWMFDAIRALGQ